MVEKHALLVLDRTPSPGHDPKGKGDKEGSGKNEECQKRQDHSRFAVSGVRHEKKLINVTGPGCGKVPRTNRSHTERNEGERKISTQSYSHAQSHSHTVTHSHTVIQPRNQAAMMDCAQRADSLQIHAHEHTQTEK